MLFNTYEFIFLFLPVALLLFYALGAMGHLVPRRREDRIWHGDRIVLRRALEVPWAAEPGATGEVRQERARGVRAVIGLLLLCGLARAGTFEAHASSENGVLRGEITGVLPAPADALWPALSRVGGQHSWVPYMRDAEVLSSGEGGALCQGRIHLPWPLRDLTWTVRMDVRAGGDRYVASWHRAQGAGNLEDTSGEWTLEPLGPDATRVHLVASAVLGRDVPPLMLRWAERKALPALLDALLAQRTDR